MTSGCGDTLSLTDLQTAKKHQLFEAEVITGKQGGVAVGTDIDYATNQVTGQTQKTLPAVLRDTGFEPASFDFTTGGTLGVNDRDKVVYDPASKTWYSWAGALPHAIAAGTNPVGDANWTPQTDPNLREELASVAENKGDALIAVKQPYSGSASRTQHEKNKEYITVGDFGAVGDGVADDSLAFNNAIQAAKLSSNSSKFVRVTAGRYRVKDVILDGPVHLIGDGKLNTTILPIADGDTCIKANSQFCRISEMTFQPVAMPNTTAIEVRAALVTVDECSFAFLKNCIKAPAGLSSAELDFRHNRFASSTYGVYLGGGQINTRFLLNTYAACKTGLFITENTAGGVASTTEGIKVIGDLFYGCGNEASGMAAIDITGTRWTWLTDVMVDLSAGVALRLTNSSFVQLTNGYYSSNSSTASSNVVVQAASNYFHAVGTKFSDSRNWGLELTKAGGQIPARVRLTDCLFQNNDLVAAQNGDLLVNSVLSVEADNCIFSSVKPNGVFIADNVTGGSSLNASRCSYYGGVALGGAACHLTNRNGVTHKDYQAGTATIPNGAISVSIPLTASSPVTGFGVVVNATAASTVTALAAGYTGGNIVVTRTGSSGDLPINYSASIKEQ